MTTLLHLLILEDRAEDAELMLHELRRAGFDPQWQRVDTEADFLAHLNQDLDVVLADYSLPQFDAQRALEHLKQRGLDVPFIIVSGCIGEERAVECMRYGATDYLLKDRLTRLGQAVRKAVDEKRLRDDRYRVEKQLVHNSFHDALTGLPNRALFLDRAQRCLHHMERREGYLFAVLAVDLDGFQAINASFGQPAGDKVLIEIGERLVGKVRFGDTVARLGGDEFALLLDDVKDVSNAMRVAERLQEGLAKPFLVDGREILTSASVGIASSIRTYKRSDDALRDAGTAMARAKRLGPGQVAVFDIRMHTQAVTRLKLETDLRLAADRQEFLLYYQPIVSLRSGRIAGFEALLRWQHPERGLISPGESLPVAEEIGLLIPIGQWVLQNASQQLRAWQMEFPVAPPLSMSINLSCKQFLHSGELLTIVDETLKATGLDPRSLTLEVTEMVMMENVEAALATLAQLKDRQLCISIDDFGTGYSSLSYLQRLPIDNLKIDQSFVAEIKSAGESLEIVRSIITLAHSLGKDVIAEGVETGEQLALLRSLGCEYGQGYFFSKPLETEAAGKLIADARMW
ncbi:MAG TPA: EAL domain-containing protein [Nitrospiraceae bacterium]|jgi:diguanylate cyclase (GGDEF)-like protein|nr:EAL domain-containing protein [Nitrospiraceae bacterium]